MQCVVSVLIFMCFAVCAEDVKQQTFDAYSSSWPDVPKTTLVDPSRLAPAPQRLIDQKDCGLKCAYFFLKLHKIEHPYQLVSTNIPIESDGVSLTGLCTGIQKLGLNVRAVRAPPQRLKELPLPAIAHMESAGKWRHYTVVFSVTGDTVNIFEPSTEAFGAMPLDTFNRLSTGLYLVEHTPNVSWLIWLVIGIIGAIITLRRWIHCGSFRKSRRGVATVVLSLLMLTGCDTPNNTGSIPIKSNLLDVPLKAFDAGASTIGKPIEHRFQITNNSRSDVLPQLGKPTCGCLSAELSPAGLLPAGSTADVIVRLDTERRFEGGVYNGSVNLGLSDHEEYHTFTLTAGVFGLAAPDGSPHRLVVDPDSERLALPYVPLRCYSQSRNPDLQILSTRCVTNEDLDVLRPVPEGALPPSIVDVLDKFDDFPQKNAKASFEIAFDLKDLTITATSRPPRSGIFENQVRLPVATVRNCPTAYPFELWLSIKYSMEGVTQRPLHIPIIVSSSDTAIYSKVPQ